MKLAEILKGQINTDTAQINSLSSKSGLSLEPKTAGPGDIDDDGKEKFWGTSDEPYEPERRKQTAALRKAPTNTNIFRKTVKSSDEDKKRYRDNIFLKNR